MSKLQTLNNNLIVESYDKVKKKDASGSPFVKGLSSYNYGVIRESSSQELPPGTRIYYRTGSNEKFIIDGVEVIAVFTKDVICKELD